MEWTHLTYLPKEVPVLFICIGCILAAILGGIVGEIRLIVSLRQLFIVFFQSVFIGMIAFFGGVNLKYHWTVKILAAGIFGFIGIPSILAIMRKFFSSTQSLLQEMITITDQAVKRTEKKDDNED